MRAPTLVTPRDFDLSPYFEIIKFNPVEATNFDYRRMKWDADDSTMSATLPDVTVKPGA